MQGWEAEGRGRTGAGGDDMLSFETGIYCKVGTGCVARRERGEGGREGRTRRTVWDGMGVCVSGPAKAAASQTDG